MNRWAHVSRRLVFFRLSAETSQYNPNKTQSALIHSRGEEESMGELLHQLLDERTRHIRRSEEHTSELQSHSDLVCRLLLEKKKKKKTKKNNEDEIRSL